MGADSFEDSVVRIGAPCASGESFDGVEGGGDAGFLAMLYEIIRDRPDVHRGWLEAELDAQLFMKDLDNATAISKHGGKSDRRYGSPCALGVTVWPECRRKLVVARETYPAIRV